MAFWLAIGPVQNWQRGLEEHKVWGVRQRYEAAWNHVKEGDILVFYAMKPIKGIIGYGTISSKAREVEPFWEEEVREGKALWPLRFYMEKVSCLPRHKWETDKVPLPALSQGITMQRALQSIKEDVAQPLIRRFSSR